MERKWLVRGLGSMKKKTKCILTFQPLLYICGSLPWSIMSPTPGGLGVLGTSSQPAVFFHLDSADSEWTIYSSGEISFEYAHSYVCCSQLQGAEEVNKQLIVTSLPKDAGPLLCPVSRGGTLRDSHKQCAFLFMFCDSYLCPHH